MEQSLFIEWVKKYFPGITVSIVKKLNDKNQTELTYRFKQMLNKRFSVTGKWESIISENTNVAADVVSMDSELPLKTRDSIGTVSGDIPKIGMKMYLNEKQLTTLDTMVAKMSTAGSNEEAETIRKQLIGEVFKDLPRVMQGVYERNELTFLRGLCTGITLAEDADNVGTGIRVDYGYLATHKFGVEELWSDAANAKPIDDILRILKRATEDGNTPRIMLMDKQTVRNLGACKQVKEQFVFWNNVNLSNTASIPNLSEEKLKEYFLSEHKLTIDIIDRYIKVERDGKRKNINPWNEGMVVLLSDYNVGDLVWANLAEMAHRKAGVEYQVADDYILLSKYHKIDPLREFTTSQARVLPVISRVDEIYTLDTKTIQA